MRRQRLTTSSASLPVTWTSGFFSVHFRSRAAATNGRCTWISNLHFFGGILHRFSGDVIGLRAHARLTKTRAGYPRGVRRQLCRVRSDAQEMPLYKQLKTGFTCFQHSETSHVYPPLKSFKYRQTRRRYGKRYGKRYAHAFKHDAC
jgi:hypothetical protein